MAGKQVLDLVREHVLSTGDDHRVVATVDVQPAVIVEVADVAGGDQPVDLCLPRPVGVAGERDRVAHHDPAGAARRHRTARVVDDPHARAKDRRADGVGRHAQMVGRRDRGNGDLRRSVQVVHDIAEPGGGPPRQASAELGAGDEDDAQIGQRGARATIVELVEQPAQHRGHHDHR